MRSTWSRFLLSSIVVLALLVLACAPAPAPTPTPVPKPGPGGTPPTAPAAQPTPAPKPAAPAPTAAPAKPTVAPASAPTVAPAKPTARPLEKINLRLGWQAYGALAYFSIAKEKGFYAEEGLDVSILEGTGGGPALQTVAAGADHFSRVDAIGMLKAVSQGMPLKMLASIYDRTPMGVACQAEKKVSKPQDLEGKSVAATPGDVTLVLFPVLLKLNGVDPSKVTTVSGDVATQTNLLLAKRVDCALSWANSNLPVFKAAGDFTFIRYADFGVNPMGDRLFTSDDLIKNKPQVARGMTRATMKGLQSMADKPDEAVAALVKQFPTVKADLALEQVKNSLPLIDAESAKKSGLGSQDKAAYEKLQDTLLQVGLMEKRIDVSQAFTNDFLK